MFINILCYSVALLLLHRCVLLTFQSLCHFWRIFLIAATTRFGDDFRFRANIIESCQICASVTFCKQFMSLGIFPFRKLKICSFQVAEDHHSDIIEHIWLHTRKHSHYLFYKDKDYGTYLIHERKKGAHTIRCGNF